MSITDTAAPATRAGEPTLSLDLQRLAGHLGAEVRGLRLSGRMSAQIVAALEQALLTHKVLFLRGQQHLDDAEQQAFARQFGELVPHPTVPSLEGTAILELDSDHGGRADSWHTDVTFEIDYPALAVLRAVTLPEFGGDTVWANTVRAYEDLPAELKTLAEQLWALHGNDYDYAATRLRAPGTAAELDEATRRYREVFTSRRIATEHPLVRVHPRTGEKSLVAGHFIKKFLGYHGADSRRLLELFQSHITRLENTVRWRWQPGDVAIWDNRATQHIAINDYGSTKRVMRRVTVVGEVPVAVDGRRSRAVQQP